MSDSIQVKVAEQGMDVKLSWTGEGWSKTYCVNGARLRLASKKVREVLQAIATEYLSPAGSYVPFLRRLKVEGEDLRTALFAAENTTDLVAFLNVQSESQNLRVYSDGSVQVPWNFVFAGEATVPSEPSKSIADFKDFWSCRYNVTIRFASTDIPPNRPASRSKIKTLFALHENRFAKAAILLEESPNFSEKVKALLSHAVGAAANWSDCQTKWNSIVAEDSILYIFAHSNGQSLFLKDEEQILIQDRDLFELDANGFLRIFGKHAGNHSSTLCFINGCRTADGALGDGFLNVTSGHGFHGFIGSEAEISNEWATKYAIEFLYLMLSEGKTVEEAYQELRTAFFPMSLWYSCFAHPKFRVVEG